MMFNNEICKVVHYGRDNAKSNYELGGGCLTVSEAERDLGVIIDCDLKVSKQCTKAAATAKYYSLNTAVKKTFRFNQVNLPGYREFSLLIL